MKTSEFIQKLDEYNKKSNFIKDYMKYYQKSKYYPKF